MYTVHLPARVIPLARLGGHQTRAAVLSALRDLLARLEENPVNLGESRGVGERVVIGKGVGATYEVYPRRHLVRVLRAWTFRRRR